MMILPEVVCHFKTAGIVEVFRATLIKGVLNSPLFRYPFFSDFTHAPAILVELFVVISLFGIF